VFLVDTNVMAAGAACRARPLFGLVDWMDRNSGYLFLSVVTVADIKDGIAKTRREGASRKAGRSTEWLEALLHPSPILFGNSVGGSNSFVPHLPRSCSAAGR
jgi:predicted nucleic acid-binding protein